jgi:hypothetical protein
MEQYNCDSGVNRRRIYEFLSQVGDTEPSDSALRFPHSFGIEPSELLRRLQ